MNTFMEQIIYAQIISGVVKNLIIARDYETANFVTRATYDQDAYAVEIGNYPVAIDDIYKNNKFYRILEDGSEKLIEPKIPLEIIKLKSQIEYIKMVSGIDMEEDYE